MKPSESELVLNTFLMCISDVCVLEFVLLTLSKIALDKRERLNQYVPQR